MYIYILYYIRLDYIILYYIILDYIILYYIYSTLPKTIFSQKKIKKRLYD